MRLWVTYLDHKVEFTVALCLLKQCDIRNEDKVTVELELKLGNSNFDYLEVIPKISKFKKKVLKQ